MYRSMLVLLVMLFAGSSLASAGTIYRCSAPGGGTIFSQTPCGKDAAELATAGSKKSPTPASDAASDKAALEAVDSRCEAESRRILDGYGVRFAEANAEIVTLHKQLASATSPTGKDPSVQERIDAVEAHKTELLAAQDRELMALRSQCQSERSAVQKRQADREARAVARR